MAVYLGENPPMRSLAVADNYFTDDGLSQLVQALRGNSHLNHLNLRGCRGLTDTSLEALERMVTQVNMSLYTIELDAEPDAAAKLQGSQSQYDPDLIARIQAQAAMNRAI